MTGCSILKYILYNLYYYLLYLYIFIYWFYNKLFNIHEWVFIWYTMFFRFLGINQYENTVRYYTYYICIQLTCYISLSRLSESH